MSDRTAIIKVVATADVQLKAGQDFDAEITIPEHAISAIEIGQDLVLMIAGSSKAATGRAAAIAMGLQFPSLPPELKALVKQWEAGEEGNPAAVCAESTAKMRGTT